VQRLAAGLGATQEESRWLQALAAHGRLVRCAQRELSHWAGTAAVLDTLQAALAAINDPTERRKAPMQ